MELGVVEQRYQAVLEVLNNGVTVTEVAVRYGVSRQSVHRWLRLYAAGGLSALVDQPSKPDSCPHQTPAAVEALIVELRRGHPGWGPRTLLFQLEARGVAPLPGRSSVYRCLVRHGLIEPFARRRRKADYKRWERARAMELWQMDIVGGVKLADGSEASIVSGIDDHSRFVISAHVVARATARPTCDALAKAMRTYGVPEQVLTDNGKVFTGRFGPGAGEVLFDRICRENGIKHILTTPRSPTTTGKVERWHKTLRREFLNGKVFASIEDAQSQLDVWVHEYNFKRRHQGIGDVVPWERFRLASIEPHDARELIVEPVTTRKVGSNGKISFAAELYKVGVWLSGETVEVSVDASVMNVHHRGVLVATHVVRHRLDKEHGALQRSTKRSTVRPRPRQATVGQAVTRKVDSGGAISFAGTSYKVGRKHRRRQVQVAIVGDVVEISSGGEIIRVHPIRHDRSRENGAFANPGGRPHRSNAA
ncbi:MAG: IS481 family transposase [Acidimicrobiales bacterium]